MELLINIIYKRNMKIQINTKLTYLSNYTKSKKLLNKSRA